MKHDDFLIEILTEELPPKSLLTLAENFYQQVISRLEKAGLNYKDSKIYATPRRLAIAVFDLASAQADQEIERRGPAVSAAYVDGKPTPALLGFVRSANAELDDVFVIKNAQGEWVGLKQKIAGKSIQALLPELIESSLLSLPIAKRMRWGDNEIEFVRPVHAVMMLYGEDIVEAAILGCPIDRVTRGHRFMAPDWLTIADAKQYATTLENEGYVIADFQERKANILAQTQECVRAKLGELAKPLIAPELLDEVTGIVEWPVALCGQFHEEFLQLPKEVLISAMQDHQRYFPVVDDKGQLLPYFITISNIQSRLPAHVIHGNERVLRARLKDAAFFYEEDQKESLVNRVERLQGMVYQAKLGTLYDKANRISALASFIAEKIGSNSQQAARAGLLAKADLTTNMVGEFPELQGIMGYYYARREHETDAVQIAIRDHYLPRFANDAIPTHPLAQTVALADRIDALVGAFGIKQIPTGDKDPYGLRRAALSVLRILIQSNIDLDLHVVIAKAVSLYNVDLQLDIPLLLNFFQERLRAWYQEQGIAADIFASVAVMALTNPYDIHKRILAVNVFKTMSEAQALSIANKRVSNILAKYPDTIQHGQINPAMFEHESEKQLAQQLAAKYKLIEELSKNTNYEAVLLQLAELRQPIDNFFDHVMVMTEDKARRENRILLLSQLRALFLKVADIALLQ